MDEVKKMLRAVINGQSAMKSELLGEIKKIDTKLSARIDDLDTKTDKNFKRVNERLDSIGKSVAYLEDDAPTRDEFDHLDKRVGVIEERFAST